MIVGGRVMGVIDLDSPLVGRFDAEDQRGIEQVAAIFAAACDWAL